MKPDRKPFLLKCVVLTLVFLLQEGSHHAFAQQGAETMAAGLSQLEEKIGIQSNPALSLFDRLAGAESRVFGSVQPGSLVERIERLKNATVGGARTQAPQGASTQYQPAPPQYPAQPVQQGTGYQPAGHYQQQQPYQQPSQPYQQPGQYQQPPAQPYQQPAHMPYQQPQRQPAANQWYAPNSQYPNAFPARTAPYGYPPTTAFPPAQNPLSSISAPPAQSAPFQAMPAPSGPPAGSAARSPLSSNPASPFGSSSDSGQKPPPTLASLSFTNIYPPRFVRIESANNQQKSVSNYIPDVMKATKNRVFRFKAMPVPVYVSPGPERGFTESCIQGFEEWEERTDGIVRFIQVSDPRRARIHVEWKHLGGGGDGKDCMLGAHTITKWKAKAPGSVAMVPLGNLAVPIYIPKFGPKYTVPPQVIEVNLDLIAAKHEDVRLLVLKNVVTHELGHALGLLGHSTERSDLMYPITDEYSRLSQRDINTLTNIYKLKPDIPL